ncbi:hypothetical protein N8737_03610 [Verrucomicrobia bacterium]|nr:hypothetical protein [Verrucomicrobiota bacterium]
MGLKVVSLDTIGCLEFLVLRLASFWESSGVKFQSTSALGGAGSWKDVYGAVSPFTEAASDVVKFYRITAQ